MEGGGVDGIGRNRGGKIVAREEMWGRCNSGKE